MHASRLLPAIAFCTAAALCVGWWIWNESAGVPPDAVAPLAADSVEEAPTGDDAIFERGGGEREATASDAQLDRSAIEDADAGSRLVGRIANAEGNGIGNAQVRVRWSTGVVIGAPPSWAIPVTTAADGSFNVAGWKTSAQDVAVVVERSGFAPTFVERDVRIDMKGSPSIDEIRLALGGRVKGFVHDAQGRGIADASITLVATDISLARWTDSWPKEALHARSAADGSFAIAAVPPGVCRAVAAAPRRQVHQSAPFLVAEDREISLVPLVLQDGDVLRGHVTNRAGRGISGAQVTFGARGAAMLSPPVATVTDGSFELDHVVRGGGELRVTAAGHVPARKAIDGRSEDPIAIELSEGARIALRVVGAASGEPLERFRARARRSARDEATATDDVRDSRDAFWTPEDLEPHADGAHTLAGLTTGTWVVDVRAAEHRPFTSEPISLLDENESLALEVRLPVGLAVSGSVVRSVDGAALAGAEVAVSSALTWDPWFEPPPSSVLGRAVVAADGRFEVRGLQPGPYLVRASTSGHVPNGELVQLDAVERKDRRLELTAFATLHGLVRGTSGGRPAAVAMRTTKGERVARVDASGRYRIEELPTGICTLAAIPCEPRSAYRVSNAIPPSAFASVTLDPGADVALDLELVALSMGALRGSVRINGHAAAVYLAALVSSGAAVRSSGAATSRVEADSSLSFDDVPAGAYDVVVPSLVHPELELARERIEVEAGSTTTFAIEIATAVLEGHVEVEGSSNPPQGVLWLRPAGEPGRRGPRFPIPLSAGRFRAEDLAAGRYTAVLRLGEEFEPNLRELELKAGELHTLVIRAEPRHR